MTPIAVDALLCLQVFQVLFLAFHDWVPLGRLNDVKAAREADSFGRLITVTVVSTLPFAIGLEASFYYAGTAYPGWLWMYLEISYAVLFVGQLRAWWLPYLIHPELVRAARYQILFGKTHAFLPTRNGIRPNTLHVILHATTLSTLILLGFIA